MSDLPTHCADCNKKFGLFRWRYTCSSCKKTICYYCINGYRYLEWLAIDVEALSGRGKCEDCIKLYWQPYYDKYDSAIKNRDDVKVYSKNYQGSIDYKAGSQKDVIETKYFKDKDDAMKMLKVTAHYLDCDIVYDLNWSHKKRSAKKNSNYIYKIWSVAGIPACSN